MCEGEPRTRIFTITEMGRIDDRFIDLEMALLGCMEYGDMPGVLRNMERIILLCQECRDNTSMRLLTNDFRSEL